MIRNIFSTFVIMIIAFALAVVSVPTATAEQLEPIKEINFTSFPKGQQPWVYQQALMIKENWEKLGLKIRLEPLNIPHPLIQRLFKEKNFDATMMEGTGTVDRLDPDFFLNTVFHSKNAVPGAWNLSGFDDPSYDKLAEAQKVAYDLKKRQQLVWKCQEILFQQNPWVVTVNNNSIQAYNSANFLVPKVSIAGFNDSMMLFYIEPKGDKKTFRYGTAMADLKTINPLVFNESDQFVYVYSIYDTLVRVTPEGKPELWAAAALDTVDDTTIDVTIRKDMTFHDGKPVTVQDIKFTFDYLAQHKAVYLLKKIESVESVEILSDQKVRFKLKQPYAPFISLTLATTPIMPKHIWEKIDKPHEYRNVPPIGSCPFKFDHWRASQEFMMTKHAGHFSPPLLDGVLFVFYGTGEGVSTALKKKEVDNMVTVSAQQVMDLEELDHIKVLKIPNHTTDGVILNIRRKPFDDPKFRLALAHTIPREQMVEEIFFGFAGVGASMIAPQNEYWHNPNIKPYPYDLEKAKAILKEAGYRWNKAGRLCYPPK